MTDLQVTIFNLMHQHLSSAVTTAIKSLLSSKHLYQSQQVIFPDSLSLIREVKAEDASKSKQIPDILLENVYRDAIGFPWSLLDPNSRFSGYAGNLRVGFDIEIHVSPPTIRSFCKECASEEPYNCVGGSIAMAQISEGKPFQTICLNYQCQNCKGLSETFLLRREGSKLILCGQSPMEKVISNPILPKAERQYISDAIVAYNSGQILAGIFFLRVFIEQFVRHYNDNSQSQDIDSLFQKYASSLPEDFRSRFPSLKAVYDILSAAVHSANPSEEIFIQAKDDIETHFDAKRLFEKKPNSQIW